MGIFSHSTLEEHEEEIAQHEIRNKAREHSDMLPETRVLLQQFYAPFNEKLAALLSDNLFLWKNDLSNN